MASQKVHALSSMITEPQKRSHLLDHVINSSDWSLGFVHMPTLTNHKRRTMLCSDWPGRATCPRLGVGLEPAGHLKLDLSAGLCLEECWGSLLSKERGINAEMSNKESLGVFFIRPLLPLSLVNKTSSG